MKVTVIGANGMLGYAVSEYFKNTGHDVQALTRSTFDIANDTFNKFEKLVTAHNSDVVINCAGVIKPMIAKTKIEDVLKVNSVFPHNLGKFAVASKLKIFHITTDCVYSGLKGKYDETDMYDATDVYGMSKNAGEPTNLMTLRTSIIGEEKGEGRSLLAWAISQKGKEVNGFTNHSWNGVTTVKLAQAIDDIIKTNQYTPGLFHMHSPDSPTKLELLKMFNETYELNLKINATEAKDLCDRTMTTKHKFASTFIKESIPEQIKMMRKFFMEVNKTK
ncbi:MAG: SDR family oxidoreductase [Bdellovibrionaceae bacterium]|nr:SDR family oxidoreductase [Pseudobdellovibrionaceae bacterium]